MSFNRMISGFVFLALLCVVMIGCAGENKPLSKNVKVTLKGETGSCLGHVGEKISRYIRAELSDGQVKEVWSCLDGALDDFVSITSPEHPEGYPPGALARFFESFFVKREIPLSVAEALMNLKRVFVGGKKEFLTQKEILILKSFLVQSERWSLRLNPHLETLFLRDPAKVSLESLDQAFDELLSVGLEIGDWLQAQGQDYTQKEIKELLLSLQTWLKAEPEAKRIGSFIESLPLFFELKSLLIGGNTLSISAHEWRPFLSKTTSVLAMIQTLNLKRENQSLSSLTLDQSLNSILLRLSTLFHGVNAPYSDFAQWIEKASRLSWWPKDVPPQGLAHALRFFFQKYLLLEEVDQNFVVDERLAQALRTLANEYSSALIPGANSRFEIFLSQMGPISSNERGLIEYRLNHQKTKPQRYQLAVIYTFVRQAMKAYGVETFTKPQFEQVFSDVVGILKQLKLLEGVSLGYGSRLFLEANVFTFVSDGDEFLSEKEIGFYAWMALSSFSQSENSNSKINENFLSNFPYLLSHLEQLSASERLEFFRISERASGSEGLMMNLMVLSYLECFMLRFDSDQNSILNVSEVSRSFLTFGPTLSSLLGGVVAEDDTLAFFTYLFKYGSPPIGGGSYGGALRFLHWKLRPGQWELSSDRTRLLQILSELSQLTPNQ